MVARAFSIDLPSPVSEDERELACGPVIGSMMSLDASPKDSHDPDHVELPSDVESLVESWFFFCRYSSMAVF